MDRIFTFIAQHQLKAGDAVELICPVAGFPKHYAVYMGINRGQPEFIANMIEGVKLVKDRELSGFLQRFQVSNIERFPGTDAERRKVTSKARSRLGEKLYCFIFHNCEHFKNWVLYGKSESRQVNIISSVVAFSGVGLAVLGRLANSRGLQRAGAIVLVTLFLLFILAWIILKNKEDNQNGIE